MAVDHAGRRVEPGVADAEQPHPAVALRHGAHEPLHRVPGVGALVHLAGGLAGDVWAHVLEGPLAAVAAADILLREDEALTPVGLHRAARRSPGVGAVGGAAVGGALQQHREGAAASAGLGAELRDEEHGEEARAVPHGHHVLVLGEVGAEEGEVLVGGGAVAAAVARGDAPVRAGGPPCCCGAGCWGRGGVALATKLLVEVGQAPRHPAALPLFLWTRGVAQRMSGMDKGLGF